MTYLFDACALIAFLNEEKEEGFEKVDALLNRAASGEITIYMSIVNLVEVYYGYIGDCGAAVADEIMRPVRSRASVGRLVCKTVSVTPCAPPLYAKGTYPSGLYRAFKNF